MAESRSQIAERQSRPLKSRASSLVSALTNSPIFARGFTAGAGFVQLIKQCVSPVRETFANHGNDEDEGEEEDDDDDAMDTTPTSPAHSIFKSLSRENSGMEIDASAIPVPIIILAKLEQCQNARKRHRDFLQWVENKQQPAQDLYARGEAAVDQLRDRMEYNRQVDGPMSTYDELGQRLEDIQRCLDTIDRDAELDGEALQDIEFEVRSLGEELTQLLEDWLANEYGFFQEAQGPEIPDYEAPFDITIIDEAEAACGRRYAEDGEEEVELRQLPFQPEYAIRGRKWVEEEVRSRLGMAQNVLNNHTDWLNKLKEIEAARAEGDLSYGTLEVPEESSLEEALVAAEKQVEEDAHELQECIDAGRSMGMEIDSDGNVNFDQLPDVGPVDPSCVGAMPIMWGEQQPDDDREWTEEELAEKAIEAAEIIHPWLDDIHESVSPNDVENLGPSISAVEDAQLDTGCELSDPTPDDSSSRPDNNRIYLGYSVYRIEINRMEELREKARSELPPDALPAENDFNSTPGFSE